MLNELEADSFVIVHGFVQELLLRIVEIFLGGVEDVFNVDLRAILFLLVHHDVSVVDMSHRACQETC